MIWTSLDTWIVVAGILAGLSCALLGNFLVLRKMSMMGDAISHAVLPGLAIAFFITLSRDSLPMFIGAALIGVITAVLTQTVHQLGKVEQSASMGVVFTVLFAIGLILIVRAANAVDLDPGCVLYGSIELIPLNTTSVFGVEVPKAVLSMGAVLVVDAVVVLLLWKELNLSSFDPALATTLGINAKLMHYVLMTLVAMTTVAAFESVGSIMVIAMLIVPAATAQLFARRLPAMVVLSLVITAIAAVFGHVSAITVPTWFGFADTNSAGAMAALLGLMFLIAMVVAPRQGLLSRLTHAVQVNVTVLQEDVLGLLYRGSEAYEAPPHDAADGGEPLGLSVRDLRELPHAPLSLRTSGATLGAAVLLLRLRGLVQVRRGRLALTAAGRRAAASVVRSHRLWESYLHRSGQVSVDQLHDPSHVLEHVTDDELQGELLRAGGPERTDPMGKAIPEGS
jgi:manganese/zinc/iron transport system permease protein